MGAGACTMCSPSSQPKGPSVGGTDSNSSKPCADLTAHQSSTVIDGPSNPCLLEKDAPEGPSSSGPGTKFAIQVRSGTILGPCCQGAAHVRLPWKPSTGRELSPTPLAAQRVLCEEAAASVGAIPVHWSSLRGSSTDICCSADYRFRCVCGIRGDRGVSRSVGPVRGRNTARLFVRQRRSDEDGSAEIGDVGVV